MNDNDAQKEISDLFGIIKGIIPCDKKLTNQEKLDLIYIRETKLEEKIEEALKVIDDFEKSQAMKLFDIQNCHQTLTKIKKILS